jgi:hypothetical protein
MKNRIVRSLCWFAESAEAPLPDEEARVESVLAEKGYEIQTRRVCFKELPLKGSDRWPRRPGLYLGAGGLNREVALERLEEFVRQPNLSFHLDTTAGVTASDLEILRRLVRESPAATFRFAFTAHNRPSSPFFPSASFARPGFSIGFQSTDLAEDCTTLEEWTTAMREMWDEVAALFRDLPSFLGIDSSVAPLSGGKGSLVHFVRRISGDFSKAVTTDLFLRLSRFIALENPKPVGLCGLMLPCLEDFELAEEYEAGEFTVERNLFLSLHSGLGLDTYPIGVDEDPARILQVLQLLRGLSAKFSKPLSARFVSDGKARIGERTDFRNPFLKDVVVRLL